MPDLLEEETKAQDLAPSGDTLYAELKRLVEKKGLLKRQPFYYAFKIVLTLAMLAFGVIFFIWTDSLWLRLLDAVFLGFVGTQMGFIGHDAAHRQISKVTWKNDLIGLFNSLFVGASYFWWMDTHNKHHSRPNQVSYDPAIDYSVIAFSQEEARAKKGILRAIIKYQAFLFFPMMFFYPVSMRIDSIRFLLQGKSKHRILEAFLMASHFILYFTLLLAFMEIWEAVLFIVVHQALFGLYLASVFAPNHMGMVIIEEDADLDFLVQQVVTARNLKGGRFVDFLFGGLNLQIEHHLFPKMARNKLRKAKRIVEDFCRERSVGYYETGIVQCYTEIFKDLHRVGSSLRKRNQAA